MNLDIISIVLTALILVILVLVSYSIEYIYGELEQIKNKQIQIDKQLEELKDNIAYIKYDIIALYKEYKEYKEKIKQS